MGTLWGGIWTPWNGEGFVKSETLGNPLNHPWDTSHHPVSSTLHEDVTSWSSCIFMPRVLKCVRASSNAEFRVSRDTKDSLSLVKLWYSID